MGCIWLQRKILQLKQRKYEDGHIYEEIDDFRLDSKQSTKKQCTPKQLPLRDTYGKQIINSDTWAKGSRHGSQDNLYIPMEGAKRKQLPLKQQICKRGPDVDCDKCVRHKIKSPKPVPPKDVYHYRKCKDNVSEDFDLEQCYGSYIDSLFMNDDYYLLENLSCCVCSGYRRDVFVIPNFSLSQSPCTCVGETNSYISCSREKDCRLMGQCYSAGGCSTAEVRHLHKSGDITSGKVCCNREAQNGSFFSNKLSVEPERTSPSDLYKHVQDGWERKTGSELSFKLRDDGDVSYVNTVIGTPECYSLKNKAVPECKVPMKEPVTPEIDSVRQKERVIRKQNPDDKRRFRYEHNVNGRKNKNRVLCDLILHNNSRLF